MENETVSVATLSEAQAFIYGIKLALGMVDNLSNDSFILNSVTLPGHGSYIIEVTIDRVD